MPHTCSAAPPAAAAAPAPPAAPPAAAGGAGGDAPAAPAPAPALLPKLATSYQALHAEFGPALTPYTWRADWPRADAPGLLHAML